MICLSVLFLILFLCSCEEPGITSLGEKPPLVVEGWIEEGQPPMVFVTHAADLTVDSASFDGFVEKWSRVSVFDGDTRYILTGRINKAYMPQFVYTTSRLKGKVGHSYRLVVETDTDTVESYAEMLPSPRLDKLTPVPVEGSDSLFAIRADISGIENDSYYKIFARSEKCETRFYGSFLGTFRGSSYDSGKGWTVTRGVHSGYNRDENFSHYYAEGDRVTVRVCRLEPGLFEFWHVYDNNVSLSQNLFFTFAGNCPSNITGGLGYWAAYGYSQKTVKIKRQ